MTDAAEYMLEVEALCKEFKGHDKSGRVKAVDNVSLAVKPGQFLTLLGPSGCGKTTTLRCIAGLERPHAGEIRVDGRTMFSSARRVFVQPNDRRIGMVFQSYAIWPHMNVFDNVAFPLRVGRRRHSRADVAERVERALGVVELDGLAGRYATQLSGGQQQRLALARALVIEPKLILLDEPLSNLDAKLRENLRFELKRLQREQGITTIYVTHDQSEALALSNVIALMREGRVLQVGTPMQVYDRPATRFVADFVGTTNFISGTLEGAGARPGEWTVRVADGVMTVTQAERLAPGDPCTVSIRPEHIEVRDDQATSQDDTSDNVWEGVVQTRLFVGEVMDYQMKVGSLLLRCRTPAHRRWSTGKPVSLRLPPEHCIALPRD